MCLSNVYLDEISDESLLVREASQISVTASGVNVSTLFGEQKSVGGYHVAEVNVMENYVILKPTGAPHNG